MPTALSAPTASTDVHPAGRVRHRAARTLPAVAAPVAIALLALAIGVAGAWVPYLWTDEAATISAATRSVPQLWQLLLHVDAVHGLYYLLMHAWTGVAGTAPWSLRVPSALAAAVGAAGTVVLGRALLTERAAVIAGLVFAVLPRVTWMGTEARSFAMTAALAVWVTVVLLWALRRGGRAWVLYAVLAGLGVALNIYLVLLVLAHAVTVLFVEPRWNARLRWLAAAVIAAVIASPVLLLSVSEGGQIGSRTIGLGTLATRVLVNEFFLGETPSGVHVAQGGLSIWRYSALALAVVGWALMLLAVVRRRALLERVVRTGAPGHRAVLLPWLLLPTGLVGGYSLLGHSLYNPRYFTFCAAAAALLIGAGIATFGRVALRVTALMAVVLLALPIAVSQRTPFAKSGADFGAVAADVAAERDPSAGVYFAPEPATTAATVLRTSRQIAIAYPHDFTGLRDVTIRSAPAVDATLWGVDRPLAASTARLAGLDELFVIRRQDYPARTAATEDGLLRLQGFRLVATRTSTVHTLERWERP